MLTVSCKLAQDCAIAMTDKRMKGGDRGVADWLDCTTCYHYCCGCAYGFDPLPGCIYYAKIYRCPGGAVKDHPITEDECRECASTCAGCFEKAVKYGFVEYERVKHLLSKRG